MNRLRTWLTAALLALLAVCLAAPALVAPALAAPSLWHVKGSQGDVWLFGSVHVLPPHIAWRSAEIDAALAKADIYVFEVSQDAATMARVRRLIVEKGYLPEGVLLRDLLHPEAQGKFDAAIAAAGLPAEQINHQRPWLAGLQILFAQMGKHQFGSADGVDPVLMAQARKTGKPMRYLETIDQQFELLAPDDPALELDEFESGLSDLDDAAAVVQPMVDAWQRGDQPALARLVGEDMDAFPAARKALFDDRNARWVPEIEAMLKEKHSFFITVGAGHLAGPQGVPALLRKAGHAVDGP
jgi:uncharacterized protein YbaP (TraB family)